MSKNTGESVNEVSRLLPSNDAENDDDAANNDEEQQEQSFGYSEFPLEQEKTESSEEGSDDERQYNSR